jgi:glycosyltransferase involved in cell wall biosynthesis
MHVTWVSTAHEHAGAEHYLVVLARALDLGGSLSVRAVLPPEAARTRELLAAEGVEVVTVPGLGRAPRPAALRAVRAAVAGTDLVHLNLSDQGDAPGVLGALATQRRPVVATLHNAIPERARWRDAVSLAALRAVDVLITPSAAVGRAAQAYRRPVRIVLNGLDPVDPVDCPRGVMGLPEDALVVGGVGRLHEQKAWHVLAGAAAIVRRTRPDVRFVVIGQGPLHDALADSGLDLLGPLPDAAALIAGFDVLAVPSRYEAFGYVALEALQVGTPVVAADVGGLPEVVGDAGVLVEQGDPEALAAAIEGLLGSPDRRVDLAERGRVRAARFTPLATAEGVLEVYRELLAGGAVAGPSAPR